uniref:Reverse transcriptase domain-containing protein n=1 Tax=Strongyloides papillosus TaxID=174720 RepID=A0A0N5CCY3_STREA
MGVPVIHDIKEKFVNVFTDASNESMDIYIREFDVKISRKFGKIERDWHINIKELHAIKISMDILLEELRIRKIELHEVNIVSHCDNMTARSWVLKKKGDSELVHDIVHKIVTCTSARPQFSGGSFEQGYGVNISPYRSPMEFNGAEFNERKRRSSKGWPSHPKNKKVAKK